MIGARDDHFAGFQRLAQRVEHVRLELGQLVEEQHAQMRERHLARFGARAAADERRHAGRMMRCAKRPLDRELAAEQFARERMHHRDFQDFLRR